MPVPLRTNANSKVEARFNVVTEFPNFDLHSAAAAGNVGLVEYALARGQPINSVLGGVLPLHAACAGGDEQVVKLLIEHGADVNAPRLPRRYTDGKNRDASAPIVGASGSTPLHFAAANGNKNVITTLLLRGAHANLADKHGITPEMLARQHGWLECAEVLRTWVENKDRDLREREGPVVLDEFGPMGMYGANRERHGSFGTEAEVTASTGRKRLQVKRSIDTALNLLKTSSSGMSESYLRPPPAPLSSSNNLAISQTPPGSPIRARGEYPTPGSPIDYGRHTPSPSPIDYNSRRPSLPHIAYPPPQSTSSPRNGKSSTLNKAPPSQRRPRSAGTDAERDNEPATHPFGRGGAGRMLGTKYSLMNIFKKGQAGEGSVPLDRTLSHQASTSMSLPFSSVTTLNSSALNLTSMSSSPRSSPIPISNSSTPSQSVNLNDSAGTSPPTSRSGFRFRMGSDASGRTRTSSTSQSQPKSPPPPPPSNLPQQSQTPPPPPPLPLAVDLHNALAQQQQNQTRDRAGSSSSTRYDLPSGLGISFDENGSFSSVGSISTSPLARGILRPRAPAQNHSRDRSGSRGSATSPGNRNAAVFDDDIVISGGVDGPGRTSSGPNGRAGSRPGILRAHNRSTSNGQSPGAIRALRFDPPSSGGSPGEGRKDGDGSPQLRASNSAGSLTKFRERNADSPGRRPGSAGSATGSPSPRARLERLPDSAPAAVSDFEIAHVTPPQPEEEEYAAGDEAGGEEDEYAYGRTIGPSKLSETTVAKSEFQAEIRSRHRGLSFGSSESSLSPILSNDGPAASLTASAEFPFSIHRPPPMPLYDPEESGSSSVPQLLRVPAPGDTRGRGDSVSSTSTTDSRNNPLMSASGTTSGSGGSMTVTTPILSPQTDPLITDSPRVIEKDLRIEESQTEGYVNGLEESADTPIVRVGGGVGERRAQPPLDIDMGSISSHAQAEALVQRAQQDILDLAAHADTLQVQPESAGSGWMPLSARLAAYGESLALERKLREQREAESAGGLVTTPTQSVKDTGEAPLSARAAEFMQQGAIPATTRAPGAGVNRQYSLGDSTARTKYRVKEPRRPHTSSGATSTADSTSRRLLSVDTAKSNHHPSRSTSAVESQLPVIDSDLDSPTQPTKPMPSTNHKYTKNAPRAHTPDPESGGLSRISSLDGVDTDTDLGPTLFRVSTAPNALSMPVRGKRDQARNLASQTKLTKMGFSASDAARTAPTSKRFGGLKSLMQSLKGKQ